MSLYAREIDFAFFAARLGWSPQDYADSTPVERSFIRKELETMTVSDSNLMKSAVQVAVANSFSKKNVKLWIKQAFEGDPPVSESEIAALRKAMKKNPPWTPWSRGGGSRG